MQKVLLQKVLALVLVVVTLVHARNGTRMPSRWHLLEMEEGGEYSLLLGEIGDEMFTLWLQDEYPNSFFQNICNSTGYGVASANVRFDYLDQFPCIYSEHTNDFYFCDADARSSDDFIVALKCFEEETDPEYGLIGAGLYFLDEETEEIERGREGLLVVHFADRSADETDGWLSGTVCDDRFNNHSADLSCQYLGYEYAEEWGSGRQYVPASILEEYNIDILVDEVYCDESKTNITDCEADVLDGHDCSSSENLWLRCAGNNSEPEWEFEEAYLIRYQEELDEISLGFEGLVLVVLRDRNNPEVTKTGTVCDDSFNDHAANLSCQYLGYKYADAWGSEPQNDNYIPEHIYEFLKNPPILVDDVQCDEWTTSIMECEARLINHDCSRSENLWLKCSEEDGEEEGTEEEGTEEEGTEEQGLDLEFGGVKLNLNLNKIHTKWNF